MAGFFELKDLQARKQALVAESEAYRRTLNLEIYNLRLYGAGLRKKLRFFRLLQPALGLLSLVGSVAGGRASSAGRQRRPGGWRRLLRWGWLGWRFSRQYGPALRMFLDRARARKQYSAVRTDEHDPAGSR